jgi:CHASE3 domain sensor protein
LERPVYQLPDVFANQDCEILDRFHRKANELANATKERQKERIAAAAEANFEIVVVDGAVLLSVVIWLID